MMKRYLYTTSLMLITLFSAAAQTPQFTWGNYIGKPPHAEANTKIIDMAGTDYFTLESYYIPGEFRTEVILEKFNVRNEKVFTKQLVPGKGESTAIDLNAAYDYRALLFVGDKFWLCSSKYFKERKGLAAFAQQVGLDGKISMDLVELDMGLAEKRGNPGEYKFAVSDDKSRILVFHEEPYAKDQNERIGFKVFDASLKEIWSKTLELPVPVAKAPENQVLVNNEGSCFILKKIPQPKFTYSYSLYGYNPKDAGVIENAIGNASATPLQISFLTDKNQDVVAGGYYTESLKEAINGPKAHGSFFYKIDKATRKANATGLNKFSPELLQKFQAQGGVTFKSTGLRNLQLKHILADYEQGPVIVGEIAWVNKASRPMPAGSPPSYNYTFHNQQILASYLNKSGTSVAEVVVPKFQESTNDDGRVNSFLLGWDASKLYFIYNDLGFKYDDKKQVVVAGNAAIAIEPVLVVADKAGAKPPVLIPNSGTGGKRATIYLKPSVFYRISDKEYISNAVSVEHYTYGKLKF